MAKVTVKKEQNYTIISNDIFKDTRLSFKAKGLLTTMLSCPPNWNYTIEGLSKISKDGKASIRSALAELEEFGYLERKQLRDEKGSFIRATTKGGRRHLRYYRHYRFARRDR